MNPQWNTPPNGDFASYVERLSAQSALPKHPPNEGIHGLDVGMTPSSEPRDAASDARAAAARRNLQSNGEAGRVARVAGGAPVLQVAFKALGLAWVLGLIAMLIFSAPLGIVAVVFAAGLWLAFKLQRWILPPGMTTWKQWFEEMARQQQRAGK